MPDAYYNFATSKSYRIITDERGSVRLVVDGTTGAVVEEIDYDEFGIVTKDTNPGLQPFGFAGGMYDPDVQTVHFGQREYDPQTGRWLSRDPILFKGGDTNLYGYVGTVGKAPTTSTNLYGYCLNDPVNFIDPKGTTAYAVCVNNATMDCIADSAHNTVNEFCGIDYAGAAMSADVVVSIPACMLKAANACSELLYPNINPPNSSQPGGI